MSARPAAAVFRVLADGTTRPQAVLAAAAGIAPAAVAAAVAELQSLGVRIEAPAGGEYRLAEPAEPLDATAIAARLIPTVARAVDIEVLDEAASSNDVLLTGTPPDTGRMRVCVVEYQHGGRGRRGRVWSAPPGGALCLSVGWHFASPPPDLSALGLAVAVAARRAIDAAAGVAIGVKWPNDLVVDDRKLGGILVELRTDGEGTQVVVGIGVNVCMPAERLAAVSDWPHGAIDLARATGGRPVARNALAAALVNALHEMFGVFAASGFVRFAGEWARAHVLANAPAVLHADGGHTAGIVRGVDTDGALLFESNDGVRRVLVGEVSLRPMR
jgi:BirA family biotin operon repressor/biotin-[acetyl-CoA-carboxylase] ligase